MKHYFLNANTVLINILVKCNTMDKGEIWNVV